MTIALFTLFIAVLTQVLGTTYNYQFFNVLGISLSAHPITLEDNIQTALSHLPSFIASIVIPPILGFAFRFHSPKTTPPTLIKPKNSILIVRVLQQLALPVTVLILILAAFIFLPIRTAQYASGYICLFYLLNTTFNKIEKFSLKNDVAFTLFCLLYLIFFVITYLHKGEVDGIKFKNDDKINYIVKLKNEHEEFISCSSFRSFSNDVICSTNGKIRIIKKESVQEINVL